MSEKRLDQLIASLKTEGIEVAEKEAAKILAEAKQQAEQLRQTAAAEKAKVLAEAEREAAAIRAKGEAALRQAGRDYSIAVRNELLALLQKVLKVETHQAFSPDLMKKIISRLVENVGSGVELQLPAEQLQEVADYVHQRLPATKENISLVADDSLLGGFRISQQEEGWSYTVSAEAVAEALQKHLNKNWRKIFAKEA